MLQGGCSRTLAVEAGGAGWGSGGSVREAREFGRFRVLGTGRYGAGIRVSLANSGTRVPVWMAGLQPSGW